MRLDDVMNSPVLWDPIGYGETCPSSDGACALVIGSEDAARRTPHKPAWIRSGASYAEAMWAPGRDQVSPRAGKMCAKAVYDGAGIKNPWKQIDTAESYVPFAWFEAMWLENLGFCDVGEGWKAIDRGEQKFGAHLPINPSGGVLCSNPIGPSGMLRLAAPALQVTGPADVRVAILTGCGDKAFCAGADLDRLVRMMQGLRPPETEFDERIKADYTIIYKGLLRNYQVLKPIIAAVRGFCVAGGTELLSTT